MKTIISILVVSFSSLLMAGESWNKVLDCNQGTMVIDKKCSFEGQYPQSYKCQYQLVLRDKNIVDYLQVEELVPMNDNQWIVPITADQGYGNFTFKPFYSAIYMKVYAERDGLRVKVYRPAYRGATYPAENWFFEKCSLVNKY